MTTKSKHQTSAPAVQNGFSLITNQKLLALYTAMLQCRMIQERSPHVGKNGKYPMGHEAVVASVTIDLLPDDLVSTFPSDPLPLFMTGLTLRKLFAGILNGSNGRSSVGAGPDMAAIVANKAKKNKRIAVALCGGECTTLGFWQEALALAHAESLPILFVSDDSTGSLGRDPRIKPEGNDRGKDGYRLPHITVDGNDVVAVYRVASEAIAHARKGDGPTLIECQRRKTDDPLLNMERYLLGKGLFSEGHKRQVATGFSRRLDAGIEAARKSRFNGSL